MSGTRRRIVVGALLGAAFAFSPIWFCKPLGLRRIAEVLEIAILLPGAGIPIPIYMLLDESPRDHIWLVLLVSALFYGGIGAYIGSLWKAWAREDDESACATCGYCLTGNTSGVCPECGEAGPLKKPFNAKTQS